VHDGDDSIYEVTWRLPFWGVTEEGLITAPDLLTAVVVAPDVSASGYPIHHVSGPDGELTRECDDDTRMREVEFLMEVEGDLFEERVSATDLSTALDMLFLVVDPGAELRGVHAEGRRLRLGVVTDGFWERPDVPGEWVPTGCAPVRSDPRLGIE
jgi:hypothetical protein